MSIPKYCQLGSKPPRKAIFSELRRRWIAVDPDNRTSSGLAETMGQNRQHITNWCHSRPAPWWAIMWLCNELEVIMIFEPDRIALVDATRIPPSKK